jgi:hypothetical protein
MKLGKQRKKLKCVCGKRHDRVFPGMDRQKHCEQCPLALKNRKK